ncbi:MAG TPA: TRAP transporter small permease subunit [Methylibium sp.]|nr:TRAP transporter small permease subunit [Methylibium sp.]
MRPLLRLARGIDALNEFVGRTVLWLVLAAVLISAGNAVVRKLLNTSSNAWLEIQWYLFAAVFLLAAGYTLLRQEHVRIDVLLGRFPRRTQVAVECFGLVAFLLPFVVVVIALVWPLVVGAYVSGERSPNAGGLIRWPVYALVPAGFALLGLQGLSELIKRAGFLAGRAPDPAAARPGTTAEAELAEQLRAAAERR